MQPPPLVAMQSALPPTCLTARASIQQARLARSSLVAAPSDTRGHRPRISVMPVRTQRQRATQRDESAPLPPDAGPSGMN